MNLREYFKRTMVSDKAFVVNQKQEAFSDLVQAAKNASGSVKQAASTVADAAVSLYGGKDKLMNDLAYTAAEFVGQDDPTSSKFANYLAPIGAETTKALFENMKKLGFIRHLDANQLAAKNRELSSLVSDLMKTRIKGLLDSNIPLICLDICCFTLVNSSNTSEPSFKLKDYLLTEYRYAVRLDATFRKLKTRFVFSDPQNPRNVFGGKSDPHAIYRMLSVLKDQDYKDQFGQTVIGQSVQDGLLLADPSDREKWEIEPSLWPVVVFFKQLLP